MAKYFYNEIELPALPEWDKDKYPYVFIEFNPFIVNNGYHLYCLPSKPTNYPSEPSLQCAYPNAIYDPIEETDEWYFRGEWTEGTAFLKSISRIKWANFDIYNNDGSLYLAASEPVPVGGEPEPTQLAWKKHDGYENQGNWLKGRYFKVIGGLWRMLYAVLPLPVEVSEPEPVPNPNLASFAKINIVAGGGYTYDNFKWRISKTGGTDGLIFVTDGLKVGETYTFSYKFQKVSGTLSAIGGHCEAFTQVKYTVDGVAPDTTYIGGTPMSDDTEVHEVVFTGIFNGTASNNNLYVQANRKKSAAITFDIWDVKVEQGDTATPWLPAEADA